MIKTEIKLKADIKKCETLFRKLEELNDMYCGVGKLYRDQEREHDDRLFKYNYLDGRCKLTPEQISEDFAEAFNDLIIDYIENNDKEES